MKKIAQKRRRNSSFGLVASLCTFALIVAGFLTAHLVMSKLPFSPPAKGLSGNDDNTGIIARQIGNQECVVARFDNATGRTTEASGCKSAIVLDAHGDPVPMGTFRRLDAISKSFSGATR